MTKFWLTIRRNSDGAERSSLEPFGKDWEIGPDYTQEFMWSEGNYGCDCNRQLFWNRYGDEPDDEGRVCGETEYSVKITDKDGNVLYCDFDQERV